MGTEWDEIYILKREQIGEVLDIYISNYTHCLCGHYNTFLGKAGPSALPHVNFGMLCCERGNGNGMEWDEMYILKREQVGEILNIYISTNIMIHVV